MVFSISKQTLTKHPSSIMKISVQSLGFRGLRSSAPWTLLELILAFWHYPKAFSGMGNDLFCQVKWLELKCKVKATSKWHNFSFPMGWFLLIVSVYNYFYDLGHIHDFTKKIFFTYHICFDVYL